MKFLTNKRWRAIMGRMNALETENSDLRVRTTVKSGGVFEVFQDKKKNWRFRLRSSNSKIIASSEGYSSKRNAYDGVKAVKRLAARATITE